MDTFAERNKKKFNIMHKQCNADAWPGLTSHFLQKHVKNSTFLFSHRTKKHFEDFCCEVHPRRWRTQNVSLKFHCIFIKLLLTLLCISPPFVLLSAQLFLKVRTVYEIRRLITILPENSVLNEFLLSFRASWGRK